MPTWTTTLDVDGRGSARHVDAGPCDRRDRRL